MKALGVIKEIDSLETRVALVPDVISQILKRKLVNQVWVEKDAGLLAGFKDEGFRKAGADVIETKEEVIEKSDIICSIEAFNIPFKETYKGKTFLGLFDPYEKRDLIYKLKNSHINALAMELIPRTSKAQSMDVLSSQANLAGYAAVILAQSRLNKIFPMLMTAAGTISPSKVLVVGAGVAGLSAIATAKRLGAVVYGYDVRKAVKEQIESLGGKFVDISIKESAEGTGGYAKALSEDALNEQRKALGHFAKDMDVIITTAQIPGKKAPMLFNEDLFSCLKPKSVIVDLASSSGGNVPGSKSDEWREINGVFLYGANSLSRLAPKDASFVYSKNIANLLEILYKKDTDCVDLEDDIIKAVTICFEGVFVNDIFGDV